LQAAESDQNYLNYHEEHEGREGFHSKLFFFVRFVNFVVVVDMGNY